MPNFNYKGTNEDGKTVKGSIIAPTESEAYARLKKIDVTAFELSEISEEKIRFKKLTTKELSEFSRQLATMQGSGISITKAIEIISERGVSPKLNQIYNHVSATINQGNSLSEGMESCKGVFPELMINMFKSGEVSGKLDESAMKMAEYYESENRINAKIKNALVYPILLAFVMVIVVFVLFTYVLPVFFEMYEDSGTELNPMTQVLVNISDFCVDYWYLIIASAVGLVLLHKFLMKLEKVVLWVDEKKLKLYKIGGLVSIIYTSRFARTLSSLYGSGISMIDAVETGMSTVGNKYIELQSDNVVKVIKSGQALSIAMTDVDGFDPKLNSSIFVGEESGRLDEMLKAVAREYEFEANAAIEVILTYIEPLMIVVMAAIIGPILVSAMLPMFNMFTLIG